MYASLKENHKEFPNHKFVMVEKRHYLTEYIADSLSRQAAWDNVLFMNKDVLLISKSYSKQILLVGFSTRHIEKRLVNNFTHFGNHSITQENIMMISFLDSNFTEQSKILKLNEFVNLSANTLILYYKILPLFKERVSRYNKGLLSHNGMNKFIGRHKNNFLYKVENLISEINAYRERNYIC